MLELQLLFFMHCGATAGFELSSDIATETLTAVLGMDSGKVCRRLRGGWYRDLAEMVAAGQGGSNGRGRKSALGYILELELMGFPDGLEAECKRKRGARII